METYVIGDIHGCFSALKIIFERSNIKKTDTVVLLGDYIDRGPDSKAVIDFILEKQAQGFNIETLRGNHELMMLNAVNDLSMMTSWLMYGGDETLDSYGVTNGSDWQKNVPDEHWRFLKATKAFYETEAHIFVHAGLAPNTELKKQREKDIFWAHIDSPLPHNSGKIVVVGHTPQNSGMIRNTGRYIFMDTYCYSGLWLTCLNLNTGSYVQANLLSEVRAGTLNG
jgi:serine/threonine protein phosphatase 1